MNAKNLIAAATLALIGTTSFAYDAPDLATPSTLSRADVRNELVRAQRAGELPRSSQPYFSVDAALAAAQTAHRSRAAVIQELASAPHAGRANEAYGTVVAGESQRSRAEVRAEALNAQSTPYHGGE
ncbi:MAG: DUF4148 domain-containing protein [Ideonella sp.]